jgi:beta-lactamase regulating signal transducer with metallopeptidase domain
MKMSLIVFGALAASFLLRRRSAAMRHWVLAAGITCAAAVPALISVVPAWPLPVAASTAFAPYEDALTSSGSPAPARPARVASGAPVAEPAAPAAFSHGFNLGTAVQSIWLAGMAVSLSILAVGLFRLAWLALGARRITQGRWYDLAQEISRSYGLRRPIRLLQSDHPSLLVTWGLARPKVILPSAAASWTEERARVVLSHELAHIRRGDWVVQLAAELLRAFYWFNPLLWVACRRLRLESEHACDDEVMSHGVEGTDYASHLIALARALNAGRQMWLPAPAMARPSSLERRVRAMLNVHRDRDPISRGTRAAIFLLLFSVTTAVAAAQSGFATFSGTISDESGRGVPETVVILTNEARRAKYEVRTSAAGRFEFVGLPAGEYGIEAKGAGFQSLKDIVTISGQNLQRSYTFKIGTLQETINVVDGGREDRPSTIKEIVPKPRAACAPSSTGGKIVPPRKIRDYAPVFPANLRGTGTNGVVEMEGRIALDGYITDIRIIGDAHPDMANAAVAAVREWKFTETLLNCQPVDVLIKITVNFKTVSAPPPPPPPPPVAR